MYKKVSNRISSPPTVQTEPEDLSSSPIPSGPTRGHGGSSTSSLVPVAVPGGPSSAAAAWALSNNKLLVFCDIVLKHANYPNAFLGEPSCDEEDHDGSEESCEETKSTILLKNERVSESPLNSVGESARESTRSSTSSTDSVLAELEPEEVDKETFESVTCWCGKPFAGRPMIECEKCLVWYHMSCEQIRRNNIPQLFQCSKCKEKRRQKKSSSGGGDGIPHSISNNTSAGESRRNSKGSSKKRKSSSFSSASSTNSSSSGIHGSASPQSETNLSPFPHHPEENLHHHEMTPTINKSSSAGEPDDEEVEEAHPLCSQDTPTKVPAPSPPVTALIKIKPISSSPPPSRHRKSKSSGGDGEVREKKRKIGGGRGGIFPSTAVVADSSTTTCSYAVVNASHGLSSATATSTLLETQHVPTPTPGCQPPRLLPCFETTIATSSSTTHLPSSSSSSDDHRPTSSSSTTHKPSSLFSGGGAGGGGSHHHSSNQHLTSSQRSLPPPKLQPQPPPLLLSSNFVVDHQTQSSNPLLLHHPPPGVVVGGSDNNPNHPYPFRQ